MTSQTTAVHHLLQGISVPTIVIQLSKTSCWLGEREARRRLGDSTPTRFACQDLAVSHLRFLLPSHVSRTAQARSLSRFYHNFESLSSPRSLPFLSIAFLNRQPLRSPSQSGSYHNLERLSRPRSIAILSAPFGNREGFPFGSSSLPQFQTVVKTSQYRVLQYHVLSASIVESAKVSRFDPESLPQFQTVVKPLQYHVCESSRFSTSVCGLGREARFPLGICSLPDFGTAVKTSRSAVFQSAVCRFGKPRRLSLSTQ